MTLPQIDARPANPADASDTPRPIAPYKSPGFKELARREIAPYDSTGIGL